MSISDGLFIVIQFSQELIGDVSQCPLSAFAISWNGYDMVPEGTPTTITRKPISIFRHQTEPAAIVLEFDRGCTRSIQNASGTDIKITYSGGTLVGLGGAVANFSVDFTPTGLAYKGNQNDPEHAELSNISISSALKRVYRSYHSAESEHTNLSGVTVTYTLTHIDDI